MVLVGRLKIPYQDLFILTNKEIECLVHGHEIDIREEWIKDRAMTGLMVSPYAPKGYNIARDMIFPWESKEEFIYKATKEDIEATKQMWDNIDKLKNEQSKNRG
jgi:hypothetical protein